MIFSCPLPPAVETAGYFRSSPAGTCSVSNAGWPLAGHALIKSSNQPSAKIRVIREIRGELLL